MADTNPFAKSETDEKSDFNNSRLGWIVAGIAGALALVFLLLWASTRVDHDDMAVLQTRLNEATTNLTSAQAASEKSQEQVAALQSQVADLQKEQELSAHMARGLEEEMRADLESRDVTISNLQGKLTVNILDRVMFDSGESVLKTDGATVMQKIGDLLAKHPDLKIHVIGHTDNVPIRSGARGRITSNWELSTERALAAVHFLTEKAGVDPHRVGAVGYGEYRPVADNATPEGRAKNRRIAITILPDELAGADTVPTAKTGVITNSSPPPVR